MARKTRGKIGYILQAINIIPLLVFGFLIMLMGGHWFTDAMYAQVEGELRGMAGSVNTMMDALYPGDYILKGETAYRLYKGDQDITQNYELIDRLKSETGLDITLFYQDTRILTTISDGSGRRIVGTGAPDEIIQNVLTGGESRFYDNAEIYGTSYFSYYTPLRNSDGSITGILFVGRPSAKVEAAIQRSVFPLIATDLILIVIVAAITFIYNKGFAACLLQIHGFLKEVSSGNMNAKLSSQTLRRNDELGEIAQSALHMQHSLRSLVDQDTLTSLANRRSGSVRLRKVIEDSAANSTPFCVAIGDIDFFKRVNDTYGHDCGDQVLRAVSEKIRQHVRGRGFAARWGGEEFLLVFEADLPTSVSYLTDLLQDIRSMQISYDDQTVKVTMTFGVTFGDTDDIKELIRSADEKMYGGKSNGRNIVVC